ncbi:hypothetical protein OPV22_018323 [Ensete ventricosum]|uniref:NAB domain-containing protein n=1 Tax=Ensete ventricosum TaxID=4639 RepID=A0AAV8R4A6_ENSVE|nr:hypothetical protein OPV22_018323 [Ensete ventricosum]
MYYKKHPELMKLVEELYRAYRALAERYDHATGALHQAHRTMAEAFPCQFPLVMSDGSPYGSFGNEAVPHTPEVPPALRALFNPNELQKDALYLSLDSNVLRRNGLYSEQSESDRSNKTENEHQVLNGTLSKMSFEKDADNIQYQISPERTSVLGSCLSATQNELNKLNDEMLSKVKNLHGYEELNQSLSMVLEMLRKKADMQEYKLNQNLQALAKLHDTIEDKHQQCMQAEMAVLFSLIQESQREIRNDLEVKHQELMEEKVASRIHAESLETAIKDLQNKNSDLKAICKKYEADFVEKLKDREDILEKNTALKSSLSDVNIELGVVSQKILALKELHEFLNRKNSTNIAEKNVLISKVEILSQDVDTLSREKTLLENSLFCLSTELGCLRPKLKNLEESYQSLSDQHFALLAERNSLLSQVESLTQNMEKHSEKCLILKNSLSEISSKVGYLRSILKDFEESCQSLSDQNSGLLAERNSLLSQVEILTQNGEILSDKNSFLEKSLSDMNNEAGNLRDPFTQNVETLLDKNSFLEESLSEMSNEVECLRSNLKDSEEFCLSISGQNSGLLAEKTALVRQVQFLTQNMAKLSQRSSVLENSLSDVKNETGCLRSKLKNFESSCCSLYDQNSCLISERITLLSQAAILTEDMEKLSEKNSSLENSLINAGSESKLKVSEESTESLGNLKSAFLAERINLLSQLEILTQNSLRNQYSGLLVERNTLLSQVEVLTQNVEKLYDKNSFLEDSLTVVSNEVGSLRILEGIQLDNEVSKLVKEELEQKISTLSEVLDHRNDEIRYLNEANEKEIAENEVSKLVKEDLEQKISTSSEALAHRNDEIRSLYEANMVLQEEINQMCEVKLLVNSKGDLISELRKEVAENECCEREITALLSDLQLSTAYAALYEEKVHELLSVGEISSILQKETLNMEVPLTNEYVDTLKKKNDDLEGENSRLKAVLDVYPACITSLWNGIISLENLIMTMSKVTQSNHHEKEDLHLVSYLHHGSCQSGEEASSKDVDDEGLAGQCMVDDEGQNFNEISRGKYGQMMKDNKLDQESSYLQYRTNCCDGPNRIDIDDQLWEASERDCSKQKWKASTAAMEHSIELIEEEKSEYPSSDLVVEKESSVDRLEMPNRALASKQEWSKGVLARLQTEFQKLLDLETDVKELKRKMETSQMGKLPASLRYNTIYPQLNDAEGAVIVLTDTNNKLTNKAEELVWAKTPKMVAAEEDGKLQNKQEGNQII